MIDDLDKQLEQAGARGLSRRQFLRLLGLGLAAAVTPSALVRTALAKAEVKLQPRKKRQAKAALDLVAVTGRNPALNVTRAVAALGGIALFVKRGDTVVVKPNIGWDRAPEQAATTNPLVVETIVKLCVAAGAKTVKVFDNPCNNPQRCYQNSGIMEAARRAGAQVIFMDTWKYFPGGFPKDSAMADWPLYRDAVDCDCLINVPVAKHHGLAKLTLSLKNLMGVCGGDRGRIHWNIERKLPELAAFLAPDLTVIDATRILLRHGPQGGSLGDVASKDTVIAAADPVLADAYATRLFGLTPGDVPHIKRAAALGVGSADVARARIKEIAA